MPQPTVQDPFGGKGGPFQEYLDPVQSAEQNRPKWDQGQKFSGYEGTLGKTLGIFSKLAEGISQGRVQAFAKKEQSKHDAYSVMQKQADAVYNNPDTTEAQKRQILKGLGNLWAKQQQPALKGSDTAKDKGPAGQLHKFFSAAIDGMAGGKMKSPEGWDVNDVVGFQKTLQGISQDNQNGVQAQSDQLRKDFAGILPKIQSEAKAQSNFNVLSREQIFQHPDVQNLLARAGQISPGAKDDLGQLINSYPSGENPQTRARLEHNYLVEHPEYTSPPPTRAEQGYISGPQGYLAGQQPEAATQPPDVRGPGSVLRVGQEQGLPETGRMNQGPPVLDPHYQTKLDMLAISAGYKTPAIPVRYRDAETGELTEGTRDQALENDRILDRRDREQKTKDAEQKQKDALVQIKEKNRQWWQGQTNLQAYRKASLSISARREEDTRNAVGIAGASYQLRELENNEKEAPKRAMATLIGRAASMGIQPSEFADNIDKVADGISDDPSIAPHMDYIVDQVSRLKARGKTNDWSSFFPQAATQGAQPPAAKPAATPKATTPQQKPKATAPVHQDAADIGSQLGVTFGTPAAAPVPSTRDPLAVR